MASYLLYIKTRMLLTEEKEVTELEQLIASLEQLKCKDTYAAVKSVTPMLDAAAQTGLHYLSRPPEPLPKSAGGYRYRIEQADLLRALLSVFTRGGAAATDALQMAAPKRIVYISCKATSLARDLPAFLAAGYELEKACSVDQFCETVHVETVCCLHRVNS